MPRKRWIEWGGERWTLSQLAESHGIHRATLRYRIDVAKLPVARALATGIKTMQEAGRRGAAASMWRGQRFIYTAT